MILHLTDPEIDFLLEVLDDHETEFGRSREKALMMARLRELKVVKPWGSERKAPDRERDKWLWRLAGGVLAVFAAWWCFRP